MSDNIRVYAWIELIVWLIVIALFVFGVRYYSHKKQMQYKNYQIFMQDVDGLIVGSPVRFLGTQIGHVTKIQLVYSDVYSDIYIKFIITEPDLTLPTGAVATVEGSGLGGSKSLEIYPPEDDTNDKIIDSRDSTRLNKVMSLFNAIFKDLEEIFTNLDHAGKEISKVQKIEIPRHNEVTPADLDDSVDSLNKKLDLIIKKEQEFKNKMNKMQKPKAEVKGENIDESEQSEDNK